jgi:hypothetical protein
MIPPAFLTDFATGLPFVYQEVHSTLLRKYRVSWRDVLPHERRAAVDQHLSELAEKHGLPVLLVPNSINNSRHVETRIEPVVLTANAVATPGQMVRDAIFRTTLAESNYELGFDPRCYKPRGNAYYGILLHGPDAYDESRVAFTCLGFPNRELTAWVEEGHFDLEALCSVALYPEDKEQPIEDLILPRLRRRKLLQEG